LPHTDTATDLCAAILQCFTILIYTFYQTFSYKGENNDFKLKMQRNMWTPKDG